MADNNKHDYEAILKQMNIGLGDGCAGMLVTVGGKRFLLNAVNLDHAPLPISEGQLKYANEHPVKMPDGKLGVKPPTPYIAKGSAILETGHQITLACKPVKVRSAKQTGGLFD